MHDYTHNIRAENIFTCIIVREADNTALKYVSIRRLVAPNAGSLSSDFWKLSTKWGPNFSPFNPTVSYFRGNWDEFHGIKIGCPWCREVRVASSRVAVRRVWLISVETLNVVAPCKKRNQILLGPKIFAEKYFLTANVSSLN